MSETFARETENTARKNTLITSMIKTFATIKRFGKWFIHYYQTKLFQMET